MSSSTYRGALYRWLERCEIRDEHGRPVHLIPHQWRHTLGTRLINRDVPQEVVRRILDHDSPQMTAHYARLHDTTIRRHWETARKIDISGTTVVLDPQSTLAEASWAKQRLGRATQALPNGFCGLPVQKTCPHANACLTCPMFITTGEFLTQHREHRTQVLQIISAAEARRQTRLAQMNRQVAQNLDTIISTLEDEPGPNRGQSRCQLTTPGTSAPAPAGATSSPAPRRSGPSENSSGPVPLSPSKPSPARPAFPGPSSIPSPTSARKSKGSATPPAVRQRRRSLPVSAPPTPRCWPGYTPPINACARSPRKTTSSAAGSPTPSATSAQPDMDKTPVGVTNITLEQQSDTGRQGRNTPGSCTEDTVHDA